MKNVNCSAVVMIALGLLVGCSDNGEKTVCDFMSLPPESVVARVNGHDLTKGMVTEYANLRVAFYKLMEPTADDDKLTKVLNSTASACLPYFIQNVVINEASQDFQQEHGQYSEADKEEVKAWLEARYVAADARHIKSFAAFRAKMRKDNVEEAFDKQVANEINTELYLKVACSNLYAVNEFVISNVYRRLDANNALAAATNSLIQATAAQVLAKIKAGEDFAELVYDYTMDPELERGSGGDLGMCTAADFPGEEVVWEAVRDLQIGETTGLIDADDSWQILKVVDRDESDAANLQLHLARIYFRRAWEIERPSREEIVRELEEKRRQNLIKETMEERLPKVKIEFPLGKEIFPSMEPVRAMLDKIDGGATNVTTSVSTNATTTSGT